ncbi:MAG: prepilin-type N-terminal cleavage/methylation domain-containing protein, partial [Clostridia bacterium]
MKKRKGFTLVELMIVIVIIGILAAVIIPTVTNAIEKAKFSNDQSDAKNMNTVLAMYCAENNIDMKLLEAPEVRAIVSSGEKNYTFNPKSKTSTFWYNQAEGKIEIDKGEALVSSKLNSVNAATVGGSIEEIVPGKLYLNTTGELANVL